MSATDELRRLLDERGVEWGNVRNDGSESNFFTEWQFDGIDGRATATEWSAGNNLSMAIYRWGLTPEQAIDATLGRGTCRNISPKLGNDEFTCEECLARVYGSGGQWFDANWKYHKFNYCPNCGARVVDE